MFTLMLVEISDDQRTRFFVKPSMNYMEIEEAFKNGTLTTQTGQPEIIALPPFEHFRHNFRELPADKLARIQAILAEPPAPQRKRRSDAGTKRQNNQPELPVTSKTT